MIEIRNLFHAFGNQVVFRDFNLILKEGELLFLLGPSGIGKSVLLKFIVGLLKFDRGEIFVDGRAISSLSERDFASVRKVCGLVFQSPTLFDFLSVYENVAFGLRRLKNLTEKEIEYIVHKKLEDVDARECENLYPNELSYGTQKKVSVARTMALDPKILLYDEPTTGLDPVSTKNINDLIRSLSTNHGITSLVVSHDMECALSAATRIVLLQGGCIADEGTPNEIRQSNHALTEEFLKDLTSPKSMGLK